MMKKPTILAAASVIALLAGISVFLLIRTSFLHKNQATQGNLSTDNGEQRTRHDYAITPDKKWKAITEYTKLASGQFQLTVKRMDIVSETPKELYKAPIPPNQGWFPAGISADGESIYVIKGNLAPDNNLFGSWFSINKIDVGNSAITTVGRWYGNALDVYAQKNKMLLTILDQTTKTQRLVLMDMRGSIIKTYYEGRWVTENADGAELGLQNEHQDIVYFNWAAIDPDGQKAFVIVSNGFQKTKCAGICPLTRTDWPAYALLDLRTGDIKDLNTVTGRVQGWLDTKHLSVEDGSGKLVSVAIE